MANRDSASYTELEQHIDYAGVKTRGRAKGRLSLDENIDVEVELQQQQEVHM